MNHQTPFMLADLLLTSSYLTLEVCLPLLYRKVGGSSENHLIPS
jgi:hypothetical protein